MSYEQYRPNKFSLLPTVVKNLLMLNGLFFLGALVMQNSGIDLSDKLGLHFPGSEKFQPYQIITYMFMHANFMHLFFNMFALWMFGNTLENVWGSKRFLIYYIVTGIGAAFCHYTVAYFETLKPILDQVDSFSGFVNDAQFSNYFMNLPATGGSEHLQFLIDQYNSVSSATPQSAELSTIASEILKQYKTDLLNLPIVVGASGSVFGVLLAFGMMFPNTMLYIYFAIPIKAKWFVLLYGAIELISGLRGDPSDNVAHFAHLGGMLFGFILIKYWQKRSNKFY